MPLVIATSKPSFQRNIKTEMEHGKPMKQALAIAYATKKRAEARKRKMAEGGMVPNEDMSRNYDKSVMTREPSNEDNEMMHPEKSGMNPMPMDGVERLSYKKQAHDNYGGEFAKEPKRSVMPAKEDMPAHMMAKGGMAKYPTPKDMYYAKGGMAQEEEDAVPDFQGDEGAGMQTYPDPSNTEHEIFPPKYSGAHEALESDSEIETEMDPMTKRKGTIRGILNKIRMRHMGMGE